MLFLFQSTYIVYYTYNWINKYKRINWLHVFIHLSIKKKVKLQVKKMGALEITK